MDILLPSSYFSIPNQFSSLLLLFYFTILKCATDKVLKLLLHEATGSQVLILCAGGTETEELVKREREKEITVFAMQSLQQKASEWSGISIDDAFAIDDADLFHTLGFQTFVTLSTNFYNRVYDDDEEWFRSIFGNSEKEKAIQNQYEFLVQRMGGPPLYSQRRGHPALIARHRPFPLTHEAAERWLHHMAQALESTSAIDDDSKIKLTNFFRHTAYFLVAGVEVKDQNHHTPCKDAAQHPCKNF